MVDDSPDDPMPQPDSGRARRAPPTIDLEASEVSGETRNVNGGAQPEPVAEANSGAISPWVIAAVSGLVAASLVICVAWMLGWPTPAPSGAAPVSAAAFDQLAARLASVEAKTGKPSALDAAAAARLEALEKSVAALHGELAGLRAQSEKLAAGINEAKSAPRESTAAVDLTSVNERVAQLERATHAQSAEIAQEGTGNADARPADDAPLRRIVAATLLDVAVRTGDSYQAALTAAKSLADEPDTLKPLEGFATSGVPSPAALSRELLTLLPKLSPPAPEHSTGGTGLVERLQAGAAKLVRIERTDAVGDDRGAVVTRMTAAALRNDLNEARRQLKMLAPADRAAAQGWLEKADARDAALAASRQFAAGAMAALARPSP